MLLKKCLFILSFFIFLNGHSQININTNPYWKGEVEMIDGTIKNGFVQVPNVTNIKKINFKKTTRGKKEGIKRKLVKSVKVISNNGIGYLYERIALVNTLKGNASIGKSLILVEAKNNYATFYIGSGAYKVNKKTGEIVLIYRYQQGKDFPVVARYIRKKDAAKANMFFVTGYVGGFKRSARHHLIEDTALLEKIENDVLGKKDLPEIIATYLDTTNSM